LIGPATIFGPRRVTSSEPPWIGGRYSEKGWFGHLSPLAGASVSSIPQKSETGPSTILDPVSWRSPANERPCQTGDDGTFLFDGLWRFGVGPSEYRLSVTVGGITEEKLVRVKDTHTTVQLPDLQF
jgi:hypothetical protein